MKKISKNLMKVKQKILDLILNDKIYFLVEPNLKISEVKDSIIGNELLKEYIVMKGKFITMKNFEGFSYILLEDKQEIIKVKNDNIFKKKKDALEVAEQRMNEILLSVFKNNKVE